MRVSSHSSAGGDPVSPTPLIEEAFSHHRVYLVPSESVGRRCRGSFLGSVFCSVRLSVCFCARTNRFDDCSVVTECDASSSVLLARDALTIQGLLRFHVNVRTVFSISAKNDLGAWVGTALNVEATLGRWTFQRYPSSP